MALERGWSDGFTSRSDQWRVDRDRNSLRKRKADVGVTATLGPVEQSGQDKRLPEPCIFVVFGASGDLTKRKLLPELFHLRQAGLLPEEFAVVGVRAGISPRHSFPT